VQAVEILVEIAVSRFPEKLYFGWQPFSGEFKRFCKQLKISMLYKVNGP
jgi:hypothetical protein